MENLAIHYGKAAERIRRDKEIPVKELAERMDTSLSRTYELLKQSNIRTDVLTKLAAALGVTVTELMPNQLGQPDVLTPADEILFLRDEIKSLRKLLSDQSETIHMLTQLLGKPNGFSLLATA